MDSPSWSGQGRWEGKLGLEVPEGRVVFAEHLFVVREGALADLLVARAPAVIVPDDDDLRLVAHRDVGVGLLRALRRTFQDLQLEPERRGHPPPPALSPPHLRARQSR